MLERLSRLSVGIGLVWVVLVAGLGLLVGLDKPEAWAPALDHVMHSELRRAIYVLLSVVVVPIGMATVVLDTLKDPGPLWFKLAVPGAFAAVYLLFLAAALPATGQPILRAADPVAARLVPGLRLSPSPEDGASWLVRFGTMFALLAGLPGFLGLLAGLLAGGAGRR